MTERYTNGLVRPDAMKNLPDWALREFLYRHSGPALEAAEDEAKARGWKKHAVTACAGCDDWIPAH